MDQSPDLTQTVSPSDPLEEYWSWLPGLLPELRRVKALVSEQAASAGGSIGRALIKYTSQPGKMLRPGLVVLGAWAGPGGARRPVSEHLVQIAAAIEVLHLSTLIHDDVVDDASVRRGGPALHTLYGRRQAVLMGDYLLSRCFAMITEGTTRENARRLAAATGHMCRGELQQLEDIANPNYSLRDYRRRIIRKTALLFTMSLAVGASEAGASRGDLAALSRVGYGMGMAFQIIDDLLDFASTPSTLGKPVASDLRAGLITLPVILAVEKNSGLMGLLGSGSRTDREIRHLVEEVRRAGGLSGAQEEAALYTQRAVRALGQLSVRAQRDALTGLTQRLLLREY